MENSQIQDSYKSIAAESRGLFKDNGSRFIAHAYPVETEEEVKEIVAALKKEYYDARHHVYAYRLGYKGDKFRANDDGEPSGSSGRPVLGQIDSYGLSDILVVVVRYFGGIKLGIPGLIRAYKTSTADALANAQIVEKIASSYVLWLKDKCGKANPVVAIGRDSRLSGPRIMGVLEKTLKNAGVKVLLCGLASTPAMFMTTVDLKTDAAIQITASHHPFNRNGLKFFLPTGGLEGDDIKEILTLC
jgi:hypothetical protein